MNPRTVHRVNDNSPGLAHELTFSTHLRYPFLKAERICQWLKEAIDEARISQRFVLWAYVFMPDHVHMIVCPLDLNYDMASIRQAIKEPVGRKAIGHLVESNSDWLQRLTRQRGQRTERLFWKSGGGYDRNIDRLSTLEKMIHFIHENPVRRGLVSSAIEWKWSSVRWYECGDAEPIRIDAIPPDWDCASKSGASQSLRPRHPRPVNRIVFFP